MKDIYQEIWDADQAANGVQALLDSQSGDADRGFARVNSNLDVEDPEQRVLVDVHIPEAKRRTYDLCLALFDNYALPERDEEDETPRERQEVHDLVHAMVDSAPMQVARDFVGRALGTSMTRERWYTTLLEMWFRRFSQGGDPDLTGFEHVVVGEQQGAKAQGYHFWYKYYLDDGFARLQDGVHKDRFPGLVDDRITYLGSKLAHGQEQFPETVTISYRWSAPDYDREELRPLTKPTGGFFVGCSVEGLLALGSVRAHVGARAPKQAVLNGARYDLRVFRSNNNHHVRTFYPVFRGPVSDDGPQDPDPDPPGVVGPVRIVAALVNPEGHDRGRETVTLINTGVASVDLEGWTLKDKRQGLTTLAGELAAGDTVRVALDGDGAVLSNRGDEIGLRDAEDRLVDKVTYNRGQVRDQGVTTLF